MQPYSKIHWPSQRNNVASVDVFAPHTMILDTLMGILSAYEACAIPPLRRAGIRRAYELIVKEDENTSYQCLGPVNKMLNFVSRWVEEGPESEAMKMHREKLKDFMWIGAEGMMMTGTNGSQLWGKCFRSLLACLARRPILTPSFLLLFHPDTSFIAQALVDSGLAAEKENHEACDRILAWLEDCQIRDNPKHYKSAYRHTTKGAWPFSTREQSYTVSDCTAEGLKAVIMLQEGTK